MGSPGRDVRGLGSREKVRETLVNNLKALEGRQCRRWGKGGARDPLPKWCRWALPVERESVACGHGGLLALRGLRGL